MTLAAIGAAGIYTLFLWWFSTGAILWLVRRPKRSHRLSLVAGLVLALAALVVVSATRDSATAFGAVMAFTAALAIWGWHELSFLTGLITGPRTEPCPAGAAGGRRFVLAAATLIYHEVALAGTALALWALSWGHANPMGAWTFTLLFACRLSAKLNLFLGAPNFTESLFPDQLRHLVGYLRRGPVSALFPGSLAAGVALAAALAWRALAPEASGFSVVAFALLFTLTLLAVIEHAFMALPLPDTALWRWALSGPGKDPAPLPLDP